MRAAKAAGGWGIGGRGGEGHISRKKTRFTTRAKSVHSELLHPERAALALHISLEPRRLPPPRCETLSRDPQTHSDYVPDAEPPEKKRRKKKTGVRWWEKKGPVMLPLHTTCSAPLAWKPWAVWKRTASIGSEGRKRESSEARRPRTPASRRPAPPPEPGPRPRLPPGDDDVR